MSRARIADDRQWLEKHLRPLMEAGDRLAGFDASLPYKVPTYDRGYWTGLKLIALKYYNLPYLNILAPRTRVAYVDFFAGPGLDRIGKREIPIPGSPLVPLTVRETAEDRFFNHFFFCEKDLAYDSALRKRVLANMPAHCGHTFFNGDANQFVLGLPKLLDDNDIGHCLVFIDPEGLEWHWDSMKELVTRVDCDVIVNFPSAGLQRNSTKVDPATRQTVARFLGLPADRLPPTVNEEWALKVYRKNLAALGMNISTEIMITDYGSFHYHLIPAVAETSTGSPWFRVWMELRDRLRPMHGEVLNLVAQQIDGRMGKLF